MLLTIIGSIIIGAVLMFLVQMWLAQKWFFALPQLEPPTKNQYDNFKLPEVCILTEFLANRLGAMQNKFNQTHELYVNFPNYICNISYYWPKRKQQIFWRQQDYWLGLNSACLQNNLLRGRIEGWYKQQQTLACEQMFVIIFSQ